MHIRLIQWLGDSVADASFLKGQRLSRDLRTKVNRASRPMVITHMPVRDIGEVQEAAKARMEEICG